MNSIIKRPESLPDTIDKVRDFILIGEEKLKAQKAQLRAIDKVHIMGAVRDAAVKDAQRTAAYLLWAWVRLGELLPPPKYSLGSYGGTKGPPPREKSLPLGITRKTSHYAHRAADYQEIVETIINDALRGENLPILRTVLREIRKLINKKKEAAALTKLSKKKNWIITKDQTVINCDSLITDPPYGIKDESWEPDDLESFTREWAIRWLSCKADTILIFWSQQFLWDGRKWFDESLNDYKFQQLLIWHYANNKSPQSRMGFKQTWEPIFFYRKINSQRKIRISGSEWGKGLNDFDCHIAAVPQSNFNGVNQKQHPTQKPLSVMRWLINATTEPGELVCDPFAGSGTTGIAAVQLKRRFHGIEIDPEYIKLAQKRIACYGKQS